MPSKVAGIKPALALMVATTLPLLGVQVASAAMVPHPGDVSPTSHGQCISVQAVNGGRTDSGLRGAADDRSMTVMQFQQYLWNMGMDCMMM